MALLASNTKQPNSRGTELTNVCIALTATAAVFVVLRMGVRAHRKLLGFDDLFIVISLVSGLQLI